MDRREEVQLAEKYIELFNSGKLPDEKLVEALSLKWFRIRALYFIKDKDGKKVRFAPNYAQKNKYIEAHNRNIILKARQLGFTTFEMIDSLDDCLFTKDFNAGCIAHSLDDAQKIFRNKIKYAYDNISDFWLQIFDVIGLDFPAPKSDTTMSYIFTNGSEIGVSTSYRGGTLQRLHVSEFGKICRKYPEKAKEIVTGAFEAVGLNGLITLESTAEGQEGYFYDYCQSAKRLRDADKELTKLDFKFFFYPWWGNGDYKLDPDGVDIPANIKEYFQKLSIKIKVELTPEQKAWYVKKLEVLKNDMKREYPSTPKEAFEQAIDGAYYDTQMAMIRNKGQITRIPYDPRLPVYTFWDLGRNDSMAIWFMQYVHNEYRFIRYYENSGESIQFYLKKMREFEYSYSTIYLPHDANIIDLTNADNKSRKQVVEDLGFQVEVVSRVPDKQEAIQAVRDVLPLCWFDAEGCDQGVKALDSFRKEWDDKRGVYKDRPLHDWASHPCDAFEQFARGFQVYVGADSFEPEGE